MVGLDKAKLLCMPKKKITKQRKKNREKHMKKIVRLTESELKNIVRNSVKRAINEHEVNEYSMKQFRNDAAATLGAGALGLGTLAGNAYIHQDDQDANPEQQEMNQPVADEFGSVQGKLPNDTIGWEEANKDKFESLISKAVMESVDRLMNEISDDTIKSAAEKAMSKKYDAEQKYGKNSYPVAHAKAQMDKFNHAYNNRFNAANDAKKARMTKNNYDRKEGTRAYKNGIGWRTEA